MARRSLRRELNQIRSWVEDGRTDAWIAHQLEISVADLRAFKDEHGLVKGGASTPPPLDDDLDFDDDLEAVEDEDEDDDEDELDQAEDEDDDEADDEDDRDAEQDEAPPRAPLGDVRTSRIAAEEEADERGARSESGQKGGSKGSRSRRRGGRGRGSRGGRGRRRSSYEATFDHGKEGYGLWLDPSVESDPTYAEHWAGHRAVRVTIEPDAIVIRRDSAEEEEAV